ncbi:small GTP-binding protein [Tritrichomonas foetus]|uniref:Small GTP-binding protein n=1 Tax=Tritrichomonas foetus TaxID=1144522 RepID=A0A1J4JWF8_9EUKA|nr:small GTP-binding protein [Tritrichomonas foetus]|eukprot:OHT03481.1 small GTP-binding protein [Tritrichomonas foetus]
MPKVKTVLVGDAGVGKTCIAERIVRGTYTATSAATIGAANQMVTLQTERGPITFNIWDTAGQEKYRSLAPMYFSGAYIAYLVFDITNKNSLNALDDFYTLLQQRAPEECIYILVGNKMDLENQRQVTQDEAIDFSQRIGAVAYAETSALTGQGVREIFDIAASCENLKFDDDTMSQISSDLQPPQAQPKQCC